MIIFLTSHRNYMLGAGSEPSCQDSSDERSQYTVMCLSIGTPKNNKFSICSKWKIHYFQGSQTLGRAQPHYNVLEYWDM